MRRSLAKRPWLVIVFGFVLLFCAWTVLIIVAERHQPKEIPIKTHRG